jgi:hypothetical protein
VKTLNHGDGSLAVHGHGVGRGAAAPPGDGR